METEITIPSKLVDAYDAARRAYMADEEQSREWDVQNLHLFRMALDHMVRVATSDDNEVKQGSCVQAGDALNTIIQNSGGQALPRPTNPYDIVIPQQITELYDEAKKAFLRFGKSTGTRDLGHLPKFRDALDHLVTGSTFAADDPNRLENIAVAKEHLLEIAIETRERTVRELMLDIERPGLSRRYRYLRFLWNNYPQPSQIRAEVGVIEELMIQARIMKGRLHSADAGIMAWDEVQERTWELRETIRSRSIRPWLLIVLTPGFAFVGRLAADIVLK